MTFNPRIGFSPIAQRTVMENFCPQLSAKITTSGVSTSVTFSPVTGQGCQTFKITNNGSHGAYIGWGHGTATAVASSGTPAANCDYVAAGSIITQDYQLANGVVDTIAAIQDGGATVLEITIGFGQ